MVGFYISDGTSYVEFGGYNTKYIKSGVPISWYPLMTGT